MNGITDVLWTEFNYGAPIEPHVVAASWQDRVIDELKVLTNMLHVELHEINLTIEIKNLAARTGVD